MTKETQRKVCDICGGTGQVSYFKGVSRFLLSHEECPECGARCEVWSRSVGYLRPVDQWNEGKQEEFKDRRTYDRQLDTPSISAN